LAAETRLVRDAAQNKIKTTKGYDVNKYPTFSLFPAPGLQTAVRVDEKKRRGEDGKHCLETFFDLLTRRNTGRMDVVNTGTDLVGVSVLLEGVQELHVTLGRLDRNDIGVKALDGREDVIKVGVAEMGMSLESI
jgi:hypothetical protein